MTPVSVQETTLFTPENESPLKPEVSIVIPALNEELTIEEFIDWCWEGLRRAQVLGEILIIDSGSDSTMQRALSKGVRVLKTPQRGLGRAYIDALPFVRGEYLILGDCDCTYDFRELKLFVEKMREGHEFVMGSRFQGEIEEGAMPPLHRYLGTPVTTWILNFIYGSHFSDIHCGMRAITREAFQRMELQSQSWEYASEMVLKSVHMRLRTTEVPIRFLKDKEGRLSHHKRSGWFSPWKAAWINLKAMFIYGADFFLFRPGVIVFTLGALLTLSLSLGPIQIGSLELSIYWMLLGVCFSILGLQCIYMGILARIFFDYSGRMGNRWFTVFSYTRSVILSIVVFIGGFSLVLLLVGDYFRHHFRFDTLPRPSGYLAILGMLLMIAAFMNFSFTLLLHASRLSVQSKKLKSS